MKSADEPQARKHRIVALCSVLSDSQAGVFLDKEALMTMINTYTKNLLRVSVVLHLICYKELPSERLNGNLWSHVAAAGD